MIDKLFWNEDGTMQKVVQTPIPVGPDPEPTDNAALTATASCSYTSPWESYAAINDGIDPPQSNDAVNPRWGAPGRRPARTGTRTTRPPSTR
ncbi:MAG: hypothetical protein IRY92_11850 [Dactylosporangium sp.]|nr:hypothetical protein [Dactylosporangium sp.]